MMNVVKIVPAFLLLTLAVGSMALAIEGRPPSQKKSGEEHIDGAASFAPDYQGKPRLIIRGKGGHILDVQGQGVQPVAPAPSQERRDEKPGEEEQ